MGNNTTTYADNFKPAKLFGVPPLSYLTNSIYLSKTQEDYNLSGTHMSEVDANPHSDQDEVQSEFFYSLETANTSIAPTVRPVEVKGKLDFTQCFLIEPTLNSTGVAVVMIKEFKNTVYCNIRVLPYSKVGEITSTSKGSSKLVVNFPKTDIVKLNVTLVPSNTGEGLYKTHKTEVQLENITPDTQVGLTRELEFEVAKFASQICASMLEIVPDKESKVSSEFTSHYVVSFPEPENVVLPELLLGVGLIGCSVIDITGAMAVGEINTDWRYAGGLIAEVLN